MPEHLLILASWSFQPSSCLVEQYPSDLILYHATSWLCWLSFFLKKEEFRMSLSICFYPHPLPKFSSSHRRSDWCAKSIACDYNIYHTKVIRVGNSTGGWTEKSKKNFAKPPALQARRWRRAKASPPFALEDSAHHQHLRSSRKELSSAVNSDNLLTTHWSRDGLSFFLSFFSLTAAGDEKASSLPARHRVL